MRTYLYLCAEGSENAVRELLTMVPVPGSTVRELMGIAAGSWLWRTPSQEFLGVAGRIDEVERFFDTHAAALAGLQSQSHPAVSLGLVVVSERTREDDCPHGFHFSEKAISLLNGIRASVDIDVIWYDK